MSNYDPFGGYQISALRTDPTGRSQEIYDPTVKLMPIVLRWIWRLVFG